MKVKINFVCIICICIKFRWDEKDEQGGRAGCARKDSFCKLYASMYNFDLKKKQEDANSDNDAAKVGRG